MDCTPITHSVPPMYSYLVPSESGTLCDDIRIEGHAIRTGTKSFVIYLKDQLPTFAVTSEELLNPYKFSVTRPILVVSSGDPLCHAVRNNEVHIRLQQITFNSLASTSIISTENYFIAQRFRDSSYNQSNHTVTPVLSYHGVKRCTTMMNTLEFYR